MKIFGITGWKNSGKTTLVAKVVTELTARVFKVSTIKHAHHHFDIDHVGTDSYRHREAGATEVLVASTARWALIHESLPAGEVPLTEFLEKMSPVDLVIIEGFKQEAFPKLVVIRPDNNADRLPVDVTNLVALASDHELLAADYGVDGPCLDLNNIPVVADFITEYCELSGC
jgi:molybdopterin-guanine dinucleotide biosynthesis protein MobB